MSLHTIHLWGALRPLVGGAESLKVDAGTIRELFRKLVTGDQSAAQVLWERSQAWAATPG